MEDIPTLGRTDENYLVKRFVAQYDAPAYMRRAREVHAAFEDLVEHCGRRRDELLKPVRRHLGELHALAGGWTAVRPFVADDEQLRLLEGLHAELKPELAFPPAPTTSARVLGRALREVVAAIEHFNQRWGAFLQEVDFTRVNELREGYNRYYLVEKECAVRSARVARQGFYRLEPVTVEELVGRFPLLGVPRGKG